MLPRTSEEIEYHSYLIFVYDFFLKSFQKPRAVHLPFIRFSPILWFYTKCYIQKEAGFSMSWFFLIHPILQKNLKSFLSN